ncbi:hypothetical protein VNI00_002954 [Paramarasmius palmivorus]|uniref:SUZ domain-containing protein n=1 Tax=Paramarasmius palmivorus TaxID=297713 RepID=A0AAW0DXD1_9AGAR
MSFGQQTPSLSSPQPASQSSASSEPSSRIPSPPANLIMTDTYTTNSSTTSLVASPSVASSDSPPPSFDAIRSSSPTSSLIGIQSQNGDHSNPLALLGIPPDVDPQIVEALKSKDRLYVLKLGETMESMIHDRRNRVELAPPSTTYQRLLIHRCSAYYKLTADTDQLTKNISLVFSSECRIPERRIADLVPPEPTPQPTFKIMRRTQQDRRVKPRSQAGSVTGEEADLSDVEPSEAGSLGGRSSVAGGSNKKRMTIEEREAAYQEARSRIFMDFDEKGKEKEKDMSASSSTLSLSSAPTSASSTGDIDDSASSLATESERSGPSYTRRDTRRSGNASASSVSRSTRNTYTNGSGSSRNSRAPSPSSSVTYPSLLYDPSSSGQSYDPSQQHTSPGAYPPGPIMYPYPPPPQPPNPAYAPYGYYPYPYGHLPPPSQNSSDPSASPEMYPSPPPPPPQMMYGQPYVWPHPQNQNPMHPPPPMSPQNSSNQTANQPPQYPAYMPHPQGYGYPMPGYYTPPPGHTMHPPGPQFYDDTRIVNGSMAGNSNHGGYMGDHTAQQARGGNGFNGRHNNNRSQPNGTEKTRGGAPAPRSVWSYGPGISGHGLPMGSGNSSSASSVNGDAVGPRLTHSMRKMSNASTGSSGQYRQSSNGDEAASQTSSTSSSSRRTYTSTSSQHPLPPRPDWAVGLKPDPTLHATNRHHDNNSRNMSPISPPRNLNGGAGSSQSRPRTLQDPMPAALQPNDFPPLTSVATPEKRAPAAPGGAWTNSSRSLLMTPPSTQGNVVHHHQVPGVQSPNNNSMTRPEEFERPPPKAAELFNPNSNTNAKGTRRGGAPNVQSYSGRPPQQQQMPRDSMPPVADVQLTEQFRSMSMGGEMTDPVNQTSSSSQPPAGLS